MRQTIVGAYIQDDWRWRPNVTVNLGLRYEMATVPTEVQGKTTVLRHLTDPLPVCGVLVPGSCAGVGSLFSNPTLRNFEPRVGFSWDPFRDGKTFLSAGFGMFDVLPLPYLVQFNEIFSAPFCKLGNATGSPPFAPGFGGDALGVKSTDPNIDVPNLIAGPGCGSPINPGNPTHYIKTQCFAVPNPITLRGNLGRNTIIGPRLVNLDFSLFKNNHIKKISDTFNAQFRTELFNVLNHTNFAPPLDNRNIFDSAGSPIGNAGLITSTQTPSRQIQFALKLIW